MRRTIQLAFDAKQIIAEMVANKKIAYEVSNDAYRRWQRASANYERFLRMCRIMLNIPGSYEFNENTLEFVEAEQIQTRAFPPCE